MTRAGEVRKCNYSRKGSEEVDTDASAAHNGRHVDLGTPWQNPADERQEHHAYSKKLLELDGIWGDFALSRLEFRLDI